MVFYECVCDCVCVQVCVQVVLKSDEDEKMYGIA